MLKQVSKRLLSTFVVLPAKNVPMAGSALGYIAGQLGAISPGAYYRSRYNVLVRRFIANGSNSRFDETVRAIIVQRFEEIDKRIEIASTPTDGLILAETLLSLEADGDVVECGCFNGGSTAKLSILAEITGRRLTVFDSFEGLPKVDSDNIRDVNVRRGSDWVTDWEVGRYAGALEHVRANVSQFGEVSQCTFVKGWFENTLTSDNLPDHIAFAFTDVDIASSARDCITALWPRLNSGGVFFSHDIAWVKVLQVFYDPDLWAAFGEPQPMVLGAGFGMGDTSPHLGFMVKGSVAPDDIKKLMLEK